jgi:2-amino-4-hydroxy-6-hydroxymethyldihydropteridine diphosphokinase
MDYEAVLLLGSNFNNKEQFINLALEEIAKKYTINKKSSFFYSPSWGYNSKNDFVNIGVQIKCKNSPELLLREVLGIEIKLGRTRSANDSYEDRPIDIDVILYGNMIINQKELIIPHPRMHQRNFCLIPLNEIIPNYIVPGFNKTINQLLSICEDNSEVTCLK